MLDAPENRFSCGEILDLAYLLIANAVTSCSGYSQLFLGFVAFSKRLSLNLYEVK